MMRKTVKLQKVSSPPVVEDLRARNTELARLVSKLRNENQTLRVQLRLYKRRSVMLREQNALLRSQPQHQLTHSQASPAHVVPALPPAEDLVTPIAPITVSQGDTSEVVITSRRRKVSNSRKAILAREHSTRTPPKSKVTTTPFPKVDSIIVSNMLDLSFASSSSLNGSEQTFEGAYEGLESPAVKESSSVFASTNNDTPTPFRPSRTSIRRISYKEPSLTAKVRKGHRFFKPVDSEGIDEKAGPKEGDSRDEDLG